MTPAPSDEILKNRLPFQCEPVTALATALSDLRVPRPQVVHPERFERLKFLGDVHASLPSLALAGVNPLAP